LQELLQLLQLMLQQLLQECWSSKWVLVVCCSRLLVAITLHQYCRHSP